MALLNLIGFDHFKTLGYNSGNNSITLASLNSLANGLIALPGLESTPLYSALANATGFWTITEVTLSSGKVRKFLTTSGTNGTCYLNISNAQIDTVVKPGKWFMGARVSYPGGVSSSSLATILQLRIGSAAAITVTISAVGVYYVEVEIDWVNLTIKTYLNGVLQNTYSGSTYVDPTYASKLIRMGAFTAFNPGPLSGFTDHYFLVEESADVGTLSRLGPILVKPQAWSAAANVSRFTPPGSLSVLDQFNANNAINNATTDVTLASYNVQTSPHGEIGVLTAGTPTETQQIVGAQITTLSHKLQAAAAGVTQQIAQGNNQTTASKVIPGLVTAPTRKTFMFNKALDGTAWGNDKVGQIKLNIGSYRP